MLPVWEVSTCGAHLHMYISTVPCTSIEFIIITYSGHAGGDATMRFLMSPQGSEMAQLRDSTPFERQPPDVLWKNNYHLCMLSNPPEKKRNVKIQGLVIRR